MKKIESIRQYAEIINGFSGELSESKSAFTNRLWAGLIISGADLMKKEIESLKSSLLEESVHIGK